MVKKAFGLPGTGKTTWIVNQTGALVSSKEVNPYKILSVSLTKATKWALEKKLSHIGVPVGEDQIRTLHSWCYKALREKGLNPCLVTENQVKEFFTSQGFDFKTEKEISEEEEFMSSDYSSVEGNRLYQMFTKVRLTWD